MNTLKKLVEIQSYQNKEEVINFVKAQLKDIAKEILIVKNKENDDKSILVGINTNLKDISPIILSGHLDTVLPNLELYNTPPFNLTQIDGKAYGVGSIDMKSFMAIILDNIDRLKSCKTPIVLAFTTDEETTLIGIKNVIEKLKELNITPTFSIIGEPTNSEIKTISNGCYEYRVTVEGKSCHSSQIDKGINAINIIAKLISYIEQKQKEFDLTSNCGVINGGKAPNIVPDLCEIYFDIRSTKTNEVNKFVKEIENKISELEIEYLDSKIYLEKVLEILPLSDNKNKTIYDISNKLNLNISKFDGGCEAGYYQNYSGEAFIFGVGDISLAHKPNEYVEIKEYINYEELFIKLINLLDNKN